MSEPKEYIITEDMIKKILSGNAWDEDMLRSRPHPAPAPGLNKMLLRSCFGDFEDCPCDDECVVSEYCDKYCKDLKNKSKDNCKHWVDSGNLKSDCRDQGIGRYYCNKPMYEHDLAIARKAREDVLEDLGEVLNSRIAKMEILDSKSPTPLRKGILLAYRDIESWEGSQRKSLRGGDP